MKKTKTIPAILIILIGLSIFSCKKENQCPIETNKIVNSNNRSALQSNDFHVSVRRDRLVFQNLQAYELVINNPTEELKEKFIETIHRLPDFHSYNSQQNHSLIEDDFFAEMLNEDLVVQIGSFLFKLNPQTERVYVMHVGNESQYNDLINENIVNPNIRDFSMNDNILELIAAKAGPDVVVPSIRWSWWPFGGGTGGTCSQSGTAFSSASTSGSLTNGYSVSFSITHHNYGIYFTIKANSSSNVGMGQFTHVWEYFTYHVRCGTTTGPFSSVIENWSTTGQSQYEQKIYTGVINLNYYYLRGKCKHYSSSLFGSITYDGETPVIQIRKNI